MDNEQLQTYYAACRDDVEYFAKFFLSHLLEKDIPDFHTDLYRTLPIVERLALATPRGHGKTTIACVIYVLWVALFKRRKGVVIISASEGLAIEQIRKVKYEIEKNAKIRAFFGNQVSEKWTENYIILQNGVSLMARGAQAQIRGFRPDCIICDDLETQESVASEEQRGKIKEWIFKDCLNTLLPGGQFIILGTLIHPLSVLSDLLSMDNGWNKKRLQAYINGRQEAGHELWGSMWPHAKLQARKREIGSWAFAAEYMNDPVSDENAPIKESMFRYWTELPDNLNMVIAVDPAYSEDERADYKVATVIGCDSIGNRYLITYLRTHAPSGEFIDGILNLYLQNRQFVTALGIPSAGTEKEFFKSVTNRAMERKVHPPFVELKNTYITSSGDAKKNKKSRIIASLQPLFESGKYFINKAHEEAKDEILTIGSSRWDDIVDSMAYAEQLITPSYIESSKVSQERLDMAGKSSNYGLEY